MSFVKTSYVLSDRGQFVTDGDPATTTLADMDNAFAAFDKQRAANGATFVAFFHGGLVDENSFMQVTMPTLLSTYTANGKGFPYFFVWRSGPGETIMDWARDHLGGLMSNPKVAAAVTVADTEAEKQTGPPDQPTKTFLELSAKSAPPSAPTDSAALQAQLTQKYRTDPTVKKLQDIFDSNPSAQMRTMRLVRGSANDGSMTDDEVAATVRASLAAPRTTLDATSERMMALPIVIDIAAILATATVRVIWRNVHHRNHPATMTEEVARGLGAALVGQQMWQQMKQDCSGAFNATGVGTAFIQQIKKVASDGKPLRLLLIGHSAGTIYIDELMNAFADAQIPNNVTIDIVYMAAAIRSDKFSALLQAPVATRIANFRSFAMHDVDEKACPLAEGGNKFVDAIFPESLLYVIAGILEPDETDMPLAGMDRFIGTDTRFAGERGDQVIINYATHARPAVWSPTDATANPGYQCTSTTHGGFPTDPMALKSMATLIQKWV